MSINEQKNDRRIRKTKNSLKDALLTLLQEKEFKDISIKDIVAQADLNRGTFYKHFPYKEDLLKEIIEDVIIDLIQSYRDPYINKDTFQVEELTSSSIKIFEHVAKHSIFYKIIFQSNVIPGFQNRMVHELKTLAIEDMTVFNTNPNINRELQTSYYTHALLGMVTEWVQGDFKYTPQYMAEQLIEIIHERPSFASITAKPTQGG
ncbi:TetR/AcrR family transcriptional regulator [Cytobacillus sp. Hz8]|uniref:TetR/AcrR family transcriptional regulator n=1 Tax=Cytobacillus sp. Hz8 TaxID=3347168 RepID=UPI0035E2BB5D